MFGISGEGAQVFCVSMIIQPRVAYKRNNIIVYAMRKSTSARSYLAVSIAFRALGMAIQVKKLTRFGDDKYQTPR